MGGLTLAVAGKGGSGKTTVSSLIIRHLLEEGKTPILAVDADPNANLNEVLGVSCPKTVADIVEEMKGKELGPGMAKDTWLEMKMEETLVETQGFDLLVMGRPEGPGCYCAANHLLRSYLDRLVQHYPYVVVDCEAGLEHVSRRLIWGINILLMIAEPTPRGVLTAERLYEMAKSLELSIDKFYLLINKVRKEYPWEVSSDLALLGEIPEDEIILQFEGEGKSFLSLPSSSLAMKKMDEFLEKIEV